MVEKTVESSAPKEPGEKADKSARLPWWHYVLIYPSIALALITAVPDWVDRGMAAYNGIWDRKYSELMQQHVLWQTNVDCLTAPPNWYTSVTGREVDATICPTGDLFLQVVWPDDNAQTPRQTQRFISIDEIVERAFAPGTEQAAATRPDEAPRFALVTAAQAAAMTERPAMPAPRAAGPMSLPGNDQQAQTAMAIVICHRFEGNNNRFLVRHVRVRSQCFDERIDTFTGATVGRTEAPCRNNC